MESTTCSTSRMEPFQPATREHLSDEAKKFVGLFKERHFKQAASSSKAITSADHLELKEMLVAICEDLSDAVLSQDPEVALHELASLIPLEQLQQAVENHYPNHEGALESAKKMLYDAKTYLEKTQVPPSPTIYRKLLALLDTLLRILDSCISAFGIAEFLKSTENDIHASLKAQKVMLLVSIFTVLTATLLPMLGVTTGASIVGGSMVFLAVLSLVYPHIRPAYTTLPGGENWSEKIRQGEVVLGGRKNVMGEITSVLLTRSKGDEGRFPLLLGQSGIGKTQTVKAFAQALVRGNYPKLKGKEVIYFNMADLVTQKSLFEGGNKSLEKLCESMGRHSQKYILVFDELHKACQSDERGLVDKLKTKLDEVFPYVIGLTTQEEYEKYIFPQTAFDRRFEKIYVESTGPDETLITVTDFLLQRASGVLYDPDIVTYLLDQTRGEPQPITALEILSQCLERTAKTQKPSKVNLIEEKQKKMDALLAVGAIRQGIGLLPHGDNKRYDAIAALEIELEDLKGQLKKDQGKIRNFFKVRERFANVTRATHLKVAALPKQETELSEFLLLSYFLAPILEARVRKQAEDLGIKTVIDQALIDEIIEENRLNRQKAKERMELEKEKT